MSALDLENVFGCQVNQISIPRLFQAYQHCGFLYPEKLERLKPFQGTIADNWERLIRSPSGLLQIFTKEPHGAFASVAVWRSTFYQDVSQHFVSRKGGPAISRAVILAAQASRIGDPICKYASNWFQPSHPVSSRLFATFVTEDRKQNASLETFEYGTLQKECVELTWERNNHLNLVRSEQFGDREANFLRSMVGDVPFAADEFETDPFLYELNQRFLAVGLHRFRKIISFVDKATDAVLAMAICYRGPLGLNFSFLENRCELYWSDELTSTLKQDVLLQLIAEVSLVYFDFPPDQIPVLIRSSDRSQLPQLPIVWQRQYARTIWTSSLFMDWYQHIDSFYCRRFRLESLQWPPAQNTS